MKVGLFGGSFNPIHNGHVAMVNGVLEKKLVDEVWIIPCKEHAFDKNLADAEDRVDMINLAFYDNPKVKINPVELNIKGKSYTYKTVRKLKKDTSNELYWICGADVCFDFPKWNKYEQLAKDIKFIVYNRNGVSVPDNCVMDIAASLHDDVGRESSTLVRNYLARGFNVSDKVPSKVEKYINRKNLYR